AAVAEEHPADGSGRAMKRLAFLTAVVMSMSLVLPALAFAHDAPESKQSRWVMTDWRMDTFFIFAGFAVVAFLAAWKAGHFHELDKIRSIPLDIDEEDYYTPEWARDEEEREQSAR